jgi:glycosyltransferase involved in cell wall biosynthesis
LPVPEVSVVIPAFNAAAYLPAAIRSVFDQSVRDLEIIVVDDGSTDDTQQLMRSQPPPVRYLRQANRGVAAARNTGIEESHGRYVAFLDADDTWLPNKLERQLSRLSGQASRLCYSAFVLVDARLAPIEVRRSQRRGTALQDLLTLGNVVGSICTVLCERELLLEAGGFDPTLSQCADWDMWVRLAARTDFLYLDEPLVTYRQHEANMSRNARLLETDSRRVLDKGFSMKGLPVALRGRRRSAMARNDMVLAGTYFQAGLYRDFLRCAARSLFRDPTQAGYLVAFPWRRLGRRHPPAPGLL